MTARRTALLRGGFEHAGRGPRTRPASVRDVGPSSTMRSASANEARTRRTVEGMCTTSRARSPAHWRRRGPPLELVRDDRLAQADDQVLALLAAGVVARRVVDHRRQRQRRRPVPVTEAVPRAVAAQASLLGLEVDPDRVGVVDHQPAAQLHPEPELGVAASLAVELLVEQPEPLEQSSVAHAVARVPLVGDAEERVVLRARARRPPRATRRWRDRRRSGTGPRGAARGSPGPISESSSMKAIHSPMASLDGGVARDPLAALLLEDDLEAQVGERLVQRVVAVGRGRSGRPPRPAGRHGLLRAAARAPGAAARSGRASAAPRVMSGSGGDAAAGRVSTASDAAGPRRSPPPPRPRRGGRAHPQRAAVGDGPAHRRVGHPLAPEHATQEHEPVVLVERSGSRPTAGDQPRACARRRRPARSADGPARDRRRSAPWNAGSSPPSAASTSVRTSSAPSDSRHDDVSISRVGVERERPDRMDVVVLLGQCRRGRGTSPACQTSARPAAELGDTSASGGAERRIPEQQPGGVGRRPPRRRATGAGGRTSRAGHGRRRATTAGRRAPQTSRSTLSTIAPQRDRRSGTGSDRLPSSCGSCARLPGAPRICGLSGYDTPSGRRSSRSTPDPP